MRVVVIGATGNMGTALLRRLQMQQEVTSIVGVARRAPDQVMPYCNVEWRLLDVAQEGCADGLAAALQGADAVVHLAWLMQPNHERETLRRTNVGGLRNVLNAVERVGVPQLVVASSVGAYSPGNKTDRVDESYPTEGIKSSHYSRDKVTVERMLDDFEGRNRQLVVTRMRPALIFQSGAGKEMDRLFLGPLVPLKALLGARLPFLPFPREFVVQAVHAEDVAMAYWLAIQSRARGAFNVAAEPVLGPAEFAMALRARKPVALPLRLLRAAVDLAWRLHAIRADAGWVDIAAGVPLLSTQRLRDELGWSPKISATTALQEIVEAVAGQQGLTASPPLRPSGDLSEQPQ